MGFFKTEASTAEIAGVSLRCEICEHTMFVCEKCGYIHWFLPT